MLFLRAVFVLSLLAFSSPAFSYDEEALAEYTRLHEKMVNLAQRNQWSGVENTYLEMVESRLTLRETDYLLAAEAARSMGNVGDVEQRYKQALTEWPSIEITQKLAAIQREYGQVLLLSKVGAIELLPDSRPFKPDLAAAIDKAQSVLQSSGRFEGMLPTGGYTLATEHFDVKVLQKRDTINVRRGADPNAGDKPDPVGAGAVEPKSSPAPGIALIGAGVAGGIAAGVMMGMAAQGKADWADTQGDLTEDQVDSVAAEVNSLATAAGVTAGVAAAAGVAGVVVIAF